MVDPRTGTHLSQDHLFLIGFSQINNDCIAAVHVDISTRNFLVADLSIKLCDFFGSAIGVGGQDTLVSEEDRYRIAPDSPRSTATDIFALGCLIFKITTGLRPYDEIGDSDYQ